MQATSLQPKLPIFPANPAFVPRPPMQAFLPPQPAQQFRHAHQNANNAFFRTSDTFHAHPPGAFPPSATTGLFTRAEAHPTAPMNFIRKVSPGQQSSMQPPSFTKTSSAPPNLPLQLGPGAFEVDAPGSRESTPASPPYPKPGHGLMAKLPPDDEDTEWLEDDNDGGAFSHIVF